MNDIYTKDVFHAIVKRERTQADRSDREFAVLVWDVSPLESETTRTQFANVIQERMRASDVLGWFDTQRLAVLLPSTSAASARILADDVDRLLKVDRTQLKYEVFGYPQAYAQPNDDSFTDPSSDAEMNDMSEGDCDLLAREDSLAPNSADHTINAMPLEPFFARPIPVWKRATDITGALTGLILLSPLFLLVAIYIRIVSPGPAFFQQNRLGYLGKPFTIWKFRTMRPSVDTGRHEQYVANLVGSDERLSKLDTNAQFIPLGRLLRKLTIDELPQLFNVLCGTMSLVGPRPDVVSIGQYHLWHRARFDAVPGMSGLWQVTGKNRTTFKEMIRLDIAYTRRFSLFLDAKILLMTLPTVVGLLRDKSGKAA